LMVYKMKIGVYKVHPIEDENKWI